MAPPDTRPVVQEDLNAMLASVREIVTSSGTMTRSFVEQSAQGINARLDRVNGRIDSAHTTLGGHDTQLALTHERVEQVAARTHELANMMVTFQKDAHATATLLERISSRIDEADRKAREAAKDAVDAAHTASNVEETLIQKFETLKSELTKLQGESRFDLKTVIVVILTSVGLTVGVVSFLWRGGPS